MSKIMKSAIIYLKIQIAATYGSISLIFRFQVKVFFKSSGSSQNFMSLYRYFKIMCPLHYRGVFKILSKSMMEIFEKRVTNF